MTRLAWRTAGESHGPCLIGIVEGLPAGLELDVERVDRELARRQRGYGRSARMNFERDRIEILGGWRAGRTIGAPVAFRIANADHTIERLAVPADPRPGHADLAGCQKFGNPDPRAVLERASARETAARVAAAGLARQVIETFGIEVFAHVVELGGEAAREDALAAAGEERLARRDASDFFSLDPAADERMRSAVDRAREAGDSLGGVFEVVAWGVPPGLGSYASGPERMPARLGAALLSIPAIKAVGFGIGFEAARASGSHYHDPIVPADDPRLARDAAGPRWGRFARLTNRAGGTEGGITTGEPIVARVAMKPIPTLRQGLPTVAFDTGEAVRSTYQRSDVTSVPAASVVGEAVVALVLAAAFLEKFAGDSMSQVRAAFEHYRGELRAL